MSYERDLHRFRECVRTRRYAMTLHAEEEMNADGYTIFDVERGILTGTILDRQRDRRTDELKFRIRGATVSGTMIELVVKRGPAGTMVIITVYAP